MERVRISPEGIYGRKVITYLLTCLLFFSMSLPVVRAEVVLDEVVRGDITVSPLGGGTTQDMTASNGAIGHFSDFDIAADNFVNCVQPSSDASALFRVFSGDGTQIYGRFDANGNIYLIDSAGILFGRGSQINVNRLIASGLDMSNSAFDSAMAGGQLVFSGGGGNVENAGTITANSVVLVGKKVLNLYGIIAPSGLVVLAAGENVYIAQDGSSVVVQVSEDYYTDSPADSVDDVRNRSLINAPGGKIVLAAGDTFSRAVSNAGILAASGGEITMQAAKVDNKYLITASSSSGNGGSVNLIGTEEVIIQPDSLGNPGSVEANAGPNGDGGSVTIQTEGVFTLEETSSITAAGGSASGKGGTVSITCGDFEIAGDISASPGNKTEKPGTLEINTPANVIIADGANAGATDTLYEDDIETLSQEATSLIVNAQEGITVKNIDDGEITGQFGNIELHATGDESAVSFDDNTDTIRTTLGDIIVESGSGGIHVGNLTTGKDLSDEKPMPGQILLSTTNGGDIDTGALTIRDGWGHAEINADASGNLTVGGDVIVGSEGSILNVAGQMPAEAVVKLNADNDVVLEGVVEAHAHGVEEDTSVTKATIDVTAGNNATINGDLLAEAVPSSTGTADAVVTVEAAGDIMFAEGVEVHATADGAAVNSTGPDYESDEANADGDHAQIIINDNAIALVDDNFSTSKSGADIVLDVLANDTEGLTTIDSYDIDPAAGSLTTDEVDGKTVLIYNPPEDLSALTFDEAGEADVTFTYTVSGRTATGTITLTNGLPVAVDDLANTYQGQAVKINVLANDTDPDSGDALSVIEGILTPKNGALVLNEDGTFTYTPDEGFLGDDSFTYSVTDGYNTSSEVEVKITVSEEPPAPPERPSTPALPYIHPAPGLDRIEWIDVKVTGCPALVKWAAEEVGIDQRLVQIWVDNSLASTGSIQPCDACAGLMNAAKILKDADGTHIAALTQVVNQFASSTAPPTEQQMSAIAEAIARNTDEDSYYATAGQYLDALVAYVGILSTNFGFSAEESVQLVTDKYVNRLTQGQSVGVAAFLAASLAALGG